VSNSFSSESNTAFMMSVSPLARQTGRMVTGESFGKEMKGAGTPLIFSLIVNKKITISDSIASTEMKNAFISTFFSDLTVI